MLPGLFVSSMDVSRLARLCLGRGGGMGGGGAFEMVL